MSRSPKATTPWTDFLAVVWKSPLIAIPFALFFSLLFHWSWAGIRVGYAIALVFSYTIGLSIWGVRWFGSDRTVSGSGRTAPRAMVRESLKYFGASVGAAMASAVLIHFTILPGFLGSPRQIAVILSFALLFSALFLGIAYALQFYEHALARARADEELNLARRIQRSFLRSNFPARPGIEMHALNVSSKEVSGDFYDVVPSGDGALFLCVADVSGKGVPAALLGSMLQASLRTQAPTLRSPARILENVNRLLCESAPNGQFATLFLGRLDEAEMTLTYVNAGHNHPLVFRNGGAPVALERGGIPLGVLEDAAFDEGVFRLEPGDRVFLYTDGVSEAADAALEQYGEERLVRVAAALPAQVSARDAIDRVLDSVRRFLDGVEPQDDITLMVLRVLDGGGAQPEAVAATRRPLEARP